MKGSDWIREMRRQADELRVAGEDLAPLRKVAACAIQAEGLCPECARAAADMVLGTAEEMAVCLRCFDLVKAARLN